jgi:hypothetical protein
MKPRKRKAKLNFKRKRGQLASLFCFVGLASEVSSVQEIFAVYLVVRSQRLHLDLCLIFLPRLIKDDSNQKSENQSQNTNNDHHSSAAATIIFWQNECRDYGGKDE